MPTRPPLLRAIAVVLLALTCAGPAAALEVQGVAVEPTQTVDHTTLVLNGAGTRRFLLLVKVYVAALYLPHRADTADAALSMDGPKAMHLVMLRDVPGAELGDKLDSGIRDNVPAAEVAALRPALDRLSALFASHKTVRQGETVTLVDTPGQGTVLRIDGVVAGEPFTEPGFFRAMLSVWLGPKPADSGLKQALLGGAAARD